MSKRGSGNKPHLWKPGQSGNPSGRPKSTLISALAAYGELKVKSKTHCKQLAATAWKEAIAGGPNGLAWAMWIADRLAGKVPQGVDLGIKDGTPTSFTLNLNAVKSD